MWEVHAGGEFRLLVSTKTQVLSRVTRVVLHRGEDPRRGAALLCDQASDTPGGSLSLHADAEASTMREKSSIRPRDRSDTASDVTTTIKQPRQN